MDIRRLGCGDEHALEQVGPCFDGPVQAAAATRFLGAGGHHTLAAYDGATVAGFVTGVEMTHPDKGTEMFLYELAVARRFVDEGTARRWCRLSPTSPVSGGVTACGSWPMTTTALRWRPTAPPEPNESRLRSCCRGHSKDGDVRPVMRLTGR
jgi:hypothetical protein